MEVTIGALAVMLVGLLLWLLPTGKLQEVGKVMFAAGLLAALLTVKTLHCGAGR